MAVQAGSPLVSVLVPTFNGAAYLDDALASVRAQTYEHLEVVLCDDGSSDDTVEIGRTFAAADRRAVVHTSERRLGPVGNFARCLERSSGPFVKFLMQDDLLEPDAVGRLLAPLLDDDRVVLSTSRRRLIDEHGEALPDQPQVRPPFARDRVLGGHALGDIALEENLNLVGEPSSVLFRRATLDAAAPAEPDDPFDLGGGGYRYLADMALWVRLLSRGGAAYLVDTLSSFRHHPDQDSRVRTNMVTSILEWQRLHHDARTRGFLASDEAWDRACRRWLENAPFFFRFCQDPSEAAALLRAMVTANAERLTVAGNGGVTARTAAVARATASCLHGALLFPAAGLGAQRVHHLRTALRRLARRGGQR